MQGTDNKLIVGGLIGLGLAGVGGAALYKYFTGQDKNDKQKEEEQKNPQKVIALIGDVGGTNIRYKLVEITGSSYQDTSIIHEKNSKVEDYDLFHLSIQDFLKQKNIHPTVAVIAIAGPVDENSTQMANAQKWGRIKGEEVGAQLNIQKFVFLNDFEANAYSLMTLKDDDIVKLNGLDPVDTQHKLIIGPGTGLGTASLIAVPRVNNKNQNFVAPGEGGHNGFSASNEEQIQYYNFLKRELKKDFIVSQACYCGPAIPYIFKFFAQKYPHEEGALTHPSSEQIVKIGIENEDSLHRKAVKFFLDIYGDVVGDQILKKLCYGGLYLVGSITLSVLPLLQDPDFKWLDSYKSKRAYLSHVFDKVPILVVKQQELGFRGAFVYAKKLIAQ